MRSPLHVPILALLLAAPFALAHAPEGPTAGFVVSSQAGATPLHLGATEVTLEGRAGDSPLVRLEIWDEPAGLFPIRLALCELDAAASATCTYRESVMHGGSGEFGHRSLVGYAYDADGGRAKAELAYARADVGAFRLVWG